MAIFTFTVTSRTEHFGETADGERAAVAELLLRAASQVRSGALPQGGQNVPEAGNLHPTNCTWAFGAPALNAGL